MRTYNAKVYDLYLHGEVIKRGTARELADYMGVPMTTIRNNTKSRWIQDTGETKRVTTETGRMGRLPGQYAFYRGEELIQIGTRREIAEQQGLKLQTLALYQGVTWKKRYPRGPHVVRLEDNDGL